MDAEAEAELEAEAEAGAEEAGAEEAGADDVELYEAQFGEEFADEAEAAEEGQEENELAPEDEAFEAQEDQAEDPTANGCAADEAQEDDIGEFVPLEEGPLVEDDGLDASDEDEDEEEQGLADHLKEAVEGSLRLKRYLSQDGEMKANKRRKLIEYPLDDEAQKMIEQLMNKWQLSQDKLVRHILNQLSTGELKQLIDMNYVPSRFNVRKTAAEQLSCHVCALKERTLGAGSRVDVVGAFRVRWNIDFQNEKRLRELSHKSLRYVIDHYDGDSLLDEVIAEAEAELPKEEEHAIHALPDGPGVRTMGRFARLELIDPLADCAVFGDANLTFSLQLARHREILGHVGRVIATTFEEIETLRERYKEIDETVKKLEDHHAEVYHGVDCTRIAIDPRFEAMESSLGAVYYNFPHSGAIPGFFDSNPVVNWRHENLMRLFFRALRTFVKPGGVVKVSSNSGAVGVRYGYIVGAAGENEFVHVETMPFMEWHMHRYGRSYGDRRDTYKRPDAKNNQSYNAQKAQADMVYCFTYAPTGKSLEKQKIRLPPTLETMMACQEGPFGNLQGAARTNLAKQLHARFVSEISGTHVG